MTRMVHRFQPAVQAFFPKGRLNPAKVSHSPSGGELSAIYPEGTSGTGRPPGDLLITVTHRSLPTYTTEKDIEPRRTLPRRFGPMVACPMTGKGVSAQWKGKDFGLGVLNRLNSDISLQNPIIGSYRVAIRSYSGHSSWILFIHGADSLPLPSLELWHSYQSIASHLLATPIPPKA